MSRVLFSPMRLLGGGCLSRRRVLVLSCLALLSVGAGVVLTQSTSAQATAFDDPGARTAGASANGAGLEPTRTDFDAGEVAAGATSQVVVLFRNTQAQPIEIGAVSLYPSSNITASVSMNDCAKEPLAAGAECPIAVSVSALQSGAWRVEMLVRHSGRTRVVTASVHGDVTEGTDSSEQLKTDLQPFPDKLEFGTLNIGKPLVKSVVLRNITSKVITVKNVAIQASANAEYNLETTCDKLETGQACLISLSWAPNQKGPSEGFIVVQHDGGTGVTSIPVTGKYEPDDLEKATVFPEAMSGKGLLVASEEKVSFGTSVNSEASITVSLVNVGDANLEIQQIGLSGSDNGLSILRKGCAPGRVLAPIEACALTLTWSPVRTGALRDDLQIIHDGARGVLVLPVEGTATGVANKDTKSIVERDGVVTRQVDRSQVLQGYVVSSHAPTRAIIVGPGGSRVVLNGQELLLGGVTWRVNITEMGVEMIDGKDKVLLLFDRSLSTGSRATSSTSASTSTSTSTSSTSTTATK